MGAFWAIVWRKILNISHWSLIMQLFCIFLGQDNGHLKGKPMFMDCNGTFSSIIERKENMYFGELTYEFWIDYGFYKGN